MLVNGEWQGRFHPVQATDAKGGFVRQTSSFRDWVGTDRFPAEAGRYHLYVALICPWASRVLAARRLKGLQEIVPITIVAPWLSDEGWAFDTFPGASGADPLHGARHLHELYTRADPHYTGRATVPLLWDTKTDTAVNNESADLLRMFGSAFDDLLPSERAAIDLYPEDLRPEIDAFGEWLYPRVNNGVYRTGFATTQAAYDEAVQELFEALDQLEVRLADGRPYLFGERLTEADIRLFVTLIRFDVAYHGAFKANLRRLDDYPALSAWTRRIYGHPDIGPTVDFDHIRTGYYSIRALNPTGIVPRGPLKILGDVEVG
jgi:putative glutathione S-transferase